MIRELYERSVFIYTMIGLCTLGILIKIILYFVYGSLAKASYNMGVSKNLLTTNMKKKFETCYKLKIGVNNVDIFVDKYLYRHKFCGILLSTWESICGQLLLSCILIGSTSTILGIVYQCGRDPILFTFTVGILASGLLIFFEGLVNTNGKKEIIRLNIKDYLENFLKVRLEQGELQPELIEQYKKELKAIEELSEQNNSAPLTAATIEPKIKKGKVITQSVKETRKERKKKLKQAKKRSETEEKAKRKAVEEEKRKEKIKEIELKKQEIKNRKLQAKEEKKKIKSDAKAAIERKKEAEKQEIEKIRAEVKLEEDRKREEKRSQEEIKRVLMLEKALQKEEKKKAEAKTLAQEKKEVLLKEINERRTHEALQNNETNLESNNTMNIIEVVPVNHVETTHHEEQNKAQEEVAASREGKIKLDTKTKEQLQNILNKGIKKGNIVEDKLIEDILKEFLS